MTLKTNVTHTYSHLLILNTACDKLAKMFFKSKQAPNFEEKKMVSRLQKEMISLGFMFGHFIRKSTW